MTRAEAHERRVMYERLLSEALDGLPVRLIPLSATFDHAQRRADQLSAKVAQTLYAEMHAE